MIKVFTDGASRGNPGPCSMGAFALRDGEKIFEISEFLGINTNNYAEYMAVIKALEKLKEMNLEEEDLVFYADSNLLVKQLSGLWKVKHPNIKPLYNIACELLKSFKKVRFEHVPRELNKEADALANLALDRYQGKL